MVLQRCKTLWGNDTVIRSAPLIEEYRDVIFVPLAKDTFLDHDRAWGIFDAKGNLIDSACYARGPDHVPVCQDPTTPFRLDDVQEAPDEPYFYGGPIINHYGHFITTTLARFWWLLQGKQPAKILCHGQGLTENWLSLPYREVMMNSLGITTADFVTFDRPIRLRRLTIPRVAMEEQNYVHVLMRKMCHQIGRSVLGDRPLVPNERPLYFSKTEIRSGVTRFSNEPEIVNVLERAGVDILMPEMMPFSDQLYQFVTRKTIVGSSSSAFHTSLFAQPHAHLICIAPNDLLNSNFALIDRVNGNWADYLYPEGTVQSTNSEGFLLNSQVANPVELAEDILRLI